MNQRRRILAAAPTPALAAQLAMWLHEPEHELVMVNTFAAALVYLPQHPDLLITEVKLGEYNGLHLALRGRAAGIPAIVLGAADLLCERETRQIGATYLPEAQLEGDELESLIQSLVPGTATRLTWPTPTNPAEGSPSVH